jgi:hypothetical protein
MSKREAEKLLKKAKRERGDTEQAVRQIWVVGVDEEAEPAFDPVVTDVSGGEGELVDLEREDLPDCVVEDCQNPSYYPAAWEGRCARCAGRPEEVWASLVEDGDGGA